MDNAWMSDSEKKQSAYERSAQAAREVFNAHGGNWGDVHEAGHRRDDGVIVVKRNGQNPRIAHNK